MNTLELAYDYLDDIEAYFRRELSQEHLDQMLVHMANHGLAHKLRGDLRDEFDRSLGCGRIQGVIQNCWNDLTDEIDPCCFEKIYMLRKDAEALNLPQGQNAPHAPAQKAEEEKLSTEIHQPAVRACLTNRINRDSLASGSASDFIAEAAL